MPQPFSPSCCITAAQAGGVRRVQRAKQPDLADVGSVVTLDCIGPSHDADRATAGSPLEVTEAPVITQALPAAAHLAAAVIVVLAEASGSHLPPEVTIGHPVIAAAESIVSARRLYAPTPLSCSMQ